jgi:hypothetical protein
MNRLKSFAAFIVIGILIAVAIIAFEKATPDSPTRALLDYPLSPGAVAGFLLGGGGEYKVLGYFSAWIVNTGLYWLLWIVLSFSIRKAWSVIRIVNGPPKLP